MTVAEVLKWMETAERYDLQQIADELIDRELVASLADLVEPYFDDSDDEVDPSLLQEAAARLQRRDYREALHVLASALGPNFARLDDVPVAA